MACNGYSLSVASSTISNNTAITSGGGIHTDELCQVSLLHSKIEDNRANTDGGGMVLLNKREWTFANVTISHNVALTGFGGGLLLSGEGNCSSKITSQVTFFNNSAGISGGGVYIIGTQVKSFLLIPQFY